MRIAPGIVFYSFMFLLGSCEFGAEDAYQQFLKKTQSESTEDEVLTLIDENEKVGDQIENLDSKNIDIEDNALLNDATVTKLKPETDSNQSGPIATIQGERKHTQAKQSYSTSKVKMSLSEIKAALKKGLYRKVANATIPSNSLEAKYYQGIAHYAMAKDGRLTKSKKLKHAQKAESIFSNVGKQAKNQSVKVRAILWHGITGYKYFFNQKSTKDLLYPFKYIQDKFSNTRYINDSFLYTALILAKKKQYAEAAQQLHRLKNTNRTDRVYDANYRKWVRPEAAGTHYLSYLPVTFQKTKGKKAEAVLTKAASSRDEGKAENNQNNLNSVKIAAMSKNLKKLQDKLKSLEVRSKEVDNLEKKEIDFNAVPNFPDLSKIEIGKEGEVNFLDVETEEIKEKKSSGSAPKVKEGKSDDFEGLELDL